MPAVHLSEPFVPVPFSAVNVDCEILFDSDCEIVEPQTVSLSRKRHAFFLRKVRKSCILMERSEVDVRYFLRVYRVRRRRFAEVRTAD